jgi:hypothetical protein
LFGGLGGEVVEVDEGEPERHSAGPNAEAGGLFT